MLKKLLKYDMDYMKRLWKTLLPVTPIAALIAAIAMRVGIEMLNDDSLSSVSNVIAPFILIVGILGTMAVLAAYIVNLVFLAKRFTANFYSDEAYLTFMLPVKREELLLSKFLNALIWNGLMAAVLIVCAFIYIVIFPVPTDGGIITFELLSRIFGSIGNSFRTSPVVASFSVVLVPIIALEALVLEIIVLHYCISAVRSIAGIALWLVANSIVGTVGLVLFSFVVLGIQEIQMSASAETALTVILLFGTVAALFAVGLIFYLKTQDNLKFRLNVG